MALEAHSAGSTHVGGLWGDCMFTGPSQPRKQRWGVLRPPKAARLAGVSALLGSSPSLRLPFLGLCFCPLSVQWGSVGPRGEPRAPFVTLEAPYLRGGITGDVGLGGDPSWLCALPQVHGVPFVAISALPRGRA